MILALLERLPHALEQLEEAHQEVVVVEDRGQVPHVAADRPRPGIGHVGRELPHVAEHLGDGPQRHHVVVLAVTLESNSQPAQQQVSLTYNQLGFVNNGQTFANNQGIDANGRALSAS